MTKEQKNELIKFIKSHLQHGDISRIAAKVGLNVSNVSRYLAGKLPRLKKELENAAINYTALKKARSLLES